MLEIKVNGELCSVAKRGKHKELIVDYLKGIMCIIETFANDINVKREDALALIYEQIIEIYHDDETEIEKE